MRIKSLPSTLRERKRYIAFIVESDHRISGEEAREALLDSTLNLLGEVRVSRLSLKIIKATSDYIIVGCNHISVEKIIGCAALTGEIRGKKIHLRSLGTSGTIKAVHKKFLSRNKEVIEAEESKVIFKGKAFTVARKFNICLDLVPDEEFLRRVKKLKVEYIGITQTDVRGE